MLRPLRSIRVGLALCALLCFSGCGDDDGGANDTGPPPGDSGPDAAADGGNPDTGAPDAGPIEDITFGESGSLAAPSGRGSFTFGVASAATQIEDMNPSTDWYLWTAPEPEGLGRHTFVADGAQGYTRALQDVDLLESLNVDLYRFSVEWARVEPERDQIDEDALAHYDALLDELVARGIEPMLTIHHFASPVWVDDPRQGGACTAPSDTHLCGWGHPEGGPLVIEEITEHARLLAERFGDRVDDWGTLNEPMNYLLASYGVGLFPPGRALAISNLETFLAVLRDYIRAHVAIYEAIHEADTIDADGDGLAATVGLPLSVGSWLPARDNAPSDDPEDVAAAGRVRAVYHYLFPEAVLSGNADTDLDGVADEEHPEWANHLDWLGVQYYFRSGVTGQAILFPGVDAAVCFGDFDLGSCVPPEDETHWIPTMRYEFWAPGLHEVLVDLGNRWPDLPLLVTESGIATEVGRRRSEHIVRSLEQIARARDEGVDVRG
ncbi:MAG: glycoside hydrolase family 1 protein, partial [Deltaproteobacteria bacterium]|nr:glycoside hydrolase family 1 protein [Deltaproteobacteria bacterium]